MRIWTSSLQPKRSGSELLPEQNTISKMRKQTSKQSQKEVKYRNRIDEAKAEAEDARGHLRELRDPDDQMRQKTERLRTLRLHEEKARTSLRENGDCICEKEAANEELRERIHEICDEKGAD